jgi:acyl carrier protein
MKPSADGTKQKLSEVEALVTEVFTDVLGEPCIGRNQDFYNELGGTSLSLMQALTRLRLKFPFELDFKDAIGCRTVKDLAACIDTQIMAAVEMMIDEDVSAPLKTSQSNPDE